MTDALRFPAGFLWGAATAAHQVEGSNVSSDWWAYEWGHLPGRRPDEPSGDAADSYHRYPDDMRLLADARLSAYRFSIEWARIEPERGFVSKAQLEHYRRMIATCREAGLEPVVTLHHFTHPAWFARDGGWRASDALDSFRRYVDTVLPIIEGVDLVCTINEPNMMSVLADPDVPWPEVGLPPGVPAVTDRMIAAHRAAVERVRSIGGRAGWSVATQDYQPEPGAEDVALAYGWSREDEFLDAAKDDDWLGVQAYTRTRIGPDGPLPIPEGAERTLTGWEYYPPAVGDGIRNARRWAGDVPIYVTENGMATADDARRIDYLSGALEAVADTIEEGVDVRGYLCWSALDNYEWGSFAPTFGLIGWDPDTFERRPKPSLAWLGDVARRNALPASRPAPGTAARE